MSQLTKGDIDHLAHLARLTLTEEEKKRYADELSVVFDYFEMLNEVNTDGVEETCQVTGLEDVTRADEVKDCDEEVRKKLLAQFPEAVGALLKVKAVFESKI